jgi:hypothetical protein
MVKKTVDEIVGEAYDTLVDLMPTNEEIDAFAELNKNNYGVVTYSKHEGGDHYFLRYHDTWGKKSGGRKHIDVGYVDEKYIDQWNVPDTTHLMLDKYSAPEFVEFIRKMRKRPKVVKNDSMKKAEQPKEGED